VKKGGRSAFLYFLGSFISFTGTDRQKMSSSIHIKFREKSSYSIGLAKRVCVKETPAFQKYKEALLSLIRRKFKINFSFFTKD
jgi:hypothetical protein